jgi:CRISPR/Cas system CSM-associated protein Csm3 (group 7 of RAMP superfamily)
VGAADPVPIVPGTSLAGVLRARALRIGNTIHPRQGQALVDAIFGPRIRDQADEPRGSRLLVEESTVRGASDWVQQRVKIDRFTGGAYPQALFAEQPVWETPQTELGIRLRLRAPKDHEIGLLLLVLKDLWTGDLPLGGERSVGRGRLQGKAASLWLQRGPADGWCVSLSQDPEGELVLVGQADGETLERYVDELHHWTPEKDDE